MAVCPERQQARGGAFHMRYDQTIYFCKANGSVYNAATGDYSEGTTVKTARAGAVTNVSETMQNLVYGKLKDKSRAVHIRQHYDASFDYIEIDGQKYGVDSSRRLRKKHTFIVSEV